MRAREKKKKKKIYFHQQLFCFPILRFWCASSKLYKLSVLYKIECHKTELMRRQLRNINIKQLVLKVSSYAFEK